MSSDSKVVILCYEEDNVHTSLCHPSHIPNEESEFIMYFPWYYAQGEQLSVKYRITSSLSLIKIKQQLLPELQQYTYFINSSKLKVAKMVHTPLITQYFTKDINIQAMTENKRAHTGTSMIKPQVVVFRYQLKDANNSRVFLTAADNSLFQVMQQGIS